MVAADEECTHGTRSIALGAAAVYKEYALFQTTRHGITSKENTKRLCHSWSQWAG